MTCGTTDSTMNPFRSVDTSSAGGSGGRPGGSPTGSQRGSQGPPVAQAFKDGVPGPAAIGFAKRCGVDPAQLDVRDTPKGECVFASVRTEGKNSVDLLQELIPGWINGLQGRRFMRWGTGSQRFSRPIRWLLALKGTDLIPVEIPERIRRCAVIASAAVIACTVINRWRSTAQRPMTTPCWGWCDRRSPASR